RGDRWPLSTFLIEICLQLHDKLTFPHINSLTLRHRVVSWRASIRHSCETTISGYTTCLFGAKSCETRYKSKLATWRRPSRSTLAYTRVVSALRCPRWSPIAFSDTPCVSKRVAHACRKAWGP